ncbi:carbamoyl-phosphate synthase (glutamine-hydrolyzing) large subunit [Fictibacillus sp. S7]|uniref:carbamoyl-phosphate synthase (glutamine-hydrolyzing) large subunit n=1 Tax=Fictibacillus sp. S7 TaxID=2212476 RepID=UPI0010123333|nr:carbamoyl-phosphate synthase (glutamine-hydrolyzing) large subunit [Fictibacillus sp. S7]RXY99511.1 carbamoyl-phosphate synthase large subunit [Fictibacillus sp. S7]
MPKHQEIHSVLVIGSGPIVIGQAAEFDYAGTQACAALKEEGIHVILVNNNPATIMTDETYADKVYFEPMTAQSVANIIKKEKPDGLLASVGGQTGLNLAMELQKSGVLEEHNVTLLGTNLDSITKAEDRECFRSLMHELNEPVPDSQIVTTPQEAIDFALEIGYPVIVRPAYTLGGFGGGTAQTEEELTVIIKKGLSASPISQCLIEKSIAGYKEIEYEVVRDANDTCITICNMENIDPVGIHTGDSLVVAPSQTMTDQEYHMLRSSAIKIIRALGIIGGCNIQFALDPESKQYYLIEVNPRLSRSSALASKATGYPIAKIAAKLSVGYHLHELKNPVTGTTYASFEPALDYITVKMPRWPFDKFPEAERKLGTQMKATGEVMAIERNLEAALQKAVRSLELDTEGFFLKELTAWDTPELKNLLIQADDRRFFAIIELLNRGVAVEEVHELTQINTFFLYAFKKLVDLYQEIQSSSIAAAEKKQISAWKKAGFTDQALAKGWSVTEEEVREIRKAAGIVPTYKMVDTCAAEFMANTSYYYSSWSGTNDKTPSNKEKIAVIGSGPIRIGQGVEFDYCCVHGVLALQEAGFETILINNNPETVSTDFEVADALYFEPLSFEDIMNVLEFEGAQKVILQFGGQTAINVAKQLEEAGIEVLGSKADLIDEMENRERFYGFLKNVNIPHVPGETAFDFQEVLNCGMNIGYPVLLRPSYVIGGKGMVIVKNEEELKTYLAQHTIEYPVLVDRYISGKEAEVDVLSDGTHAFIPGIFEHIEPAGVHSGDSTAITPPVSLEPGIIDLIVSYSKKISASMEFKGVFNIQFVINGPDVFVLEINPRASRTAPIFNKISGVNIIQASVHAMLDKTLVEQGIHAGLHESHFTAVKAPVYSNIKLPGLSPKGAPIMRSTGEVLGTGRSVEEAVQKVLTGTNPTARTGDGGHPVSLYADVNKDVLTLKETKILQSWKNKGVTIIHPEELFFEEWVSTRENGIYFSEGKDEEALVRLKKASLSGKYVFTQWETCAFYQYGLVQATDQVFHIKEIQERKEVRL